ncbi:hypothetical protein EYZ11_002215 [Aspergillus tanneri]|uniref:Uncharacterized protein n=1 Tax=Aspergillus tanneri TaxID=1220188 RepID=A0A4S3JRD3_9EURO|nr:uncharacterized protein ATNIH1004_000486 [Aspergillus tanneri]KAA8651596.1 hypothetical protein ATNIH1004_000486 [Aspergillus tanneri]THC98282.1 hypothetical protein EYZ11_002215 [Aspergillus tanneri]
MAPVSFSLFARNFNLSTTPPLFTNQLNNPTDIFSVLLILGGDVVNRAIAQLAGPRVTPVAFSFGWVAYIMTALVTVIGEHRLMPLPDSPCHVINGKTGYVRTNRSWILGRMMRDYEVWMDLRIRRHVQDMLTRRWDKMREEAERHRPGSGKMIARPKRAGLCVSVYRAERAQIGRHAYDWLWYLGLVTAGVQLGIAAIPLGVEGDWSVMLVTGAGIGLSIATGSLRQWSREKWACRGETRKTVVLTRGNGSQHAIVIVGDGKGLDLEDLAAGPGEMEDTKLSRMTQAVVTVLAVLWTLLLILAAGSTMHTWFLLAVGAVGIAENILVAGSPRMPAAYGVHLAFQEVIGEAKVMDTLFAVEKAYPHVGRSMLDTFFPGKLRSKELARWEELGQLADAMEKSLKE